MKTKDEMINEMMEIIRDNGRVIHISPLTLHATRKEHLSLGMDLLYGDWNHLDINEQHGKGEYLVVCNGSGYERNFRDVKSLAKQTIEKIFNEVMKGKK